MIFYDSWHRFTYILKFKLNLNSTMNSNLTVTRCWPIYVFNINYKKLILILKIFMKILPYVALWPKLSLSEVLMQHFFYDTPGLWYQCCSTTFAGLFLSAWRQCIRESCFSTYHAFCKFFLNTISTIKSKLINSSSTYRLYTMIGNY